MVSIVLFNYGSHTNQAFVHFSNKYTLSERFDFGTGMACGIVDKVM